MINVKVILSMNLVFLALIPMKYQTRFVENQIAGYKISGGKLREFK